MLFGYFYLSQFIGGVVINKIMFFSPLEQFEIIPLLNFKFWFYDFSFTNAVFIMIIGLIFLINFFTLNFNKKKKTANFIPNTIQYILEQLFEVILQMAADMMGKKGQEFFIFLFCLFLFIITANLIGLVPYSFTLTSHLIVTFGLALIIFGGVIIIGAKEHGIKFFGLFLPGGSSLALAPLLIPIELISFLFRVISLSVRLFSNMMAGHTLLKVVAGFAFTMMSGSGILFFSHLAPLIILLALIGLEIGVALIQSYVFLILTCLYLNESIHLH